MIDKNIDWKFPSTFEEMEERFPITRDMQACDQNPEFHKEGDVWTHTKMVIDNVRADDEWQKLSPIEREIVVAAAFCHDMAKPKVSTVEEGRIRTHKHSVVGARMVRDIFWNPSSPNYYPAPWEIREMVSNMVLLHMLPFRFLDKENPLYSVGAASQVLNNRLLSILGKADTSGRVCKDPAVTQDGVDMVQLFREYCFEKCCLDEPMLFQSDNARFRFFFERRGDPCIDFYEPIKGTVIMMAGLQGSGKDYTIQKMYNKLPMVGFDAIRMKLEQKFGEDEPKVQQELKEQTKVYMRKGQDFVFNATNLIKDIRSTWIRRFRQYGYRIKIHYIEKSLAQTFANNKSRKYIVPESIILEKFARIDVPTLLECHELEKDV